MKCTDFSKLHLAKRVYYRDGTQEIILDRLIHKDGTLEFKIPGNIWIYPINKLSYPPKDIIAFDIDELDYFLESTPTENVIERQTWMDRKNNIAFDINEPLSEERSVRKPELSAMNAEQFVEFLINEERKIDWKHIETGDLDIAEDYSSSYISYHPGLKSNEVRVILK